MNDSYGYPLQGLAWRSEIAARLRAILSRKSAAARDNVAARLLRVARRLAIPQAQLRSAVQECLATLRREARSRSRQETQPEALWSEQIRSYRARETIENYSAYLFDLPSKID